MMRRLGVVLVLPLLLGLAACTPVPPPSPAPSITPTVAASDEPVDEAPTEVEVVKEVVDAETYLLEGALNSDPDGDGFWSAHYGFYFEPTKSVRCDIWIFSGDEPGVFCSVIPGNESKVTYDLPAGTQCDLSTANPFDGYTLALGSKGLGEQLAGWSGCQEMTDADYFTSETKTLGEGQSFTVEPFGCVVNGEAAGCYFTDDSASIIFGLDTAAHAG